MKNKKTFKKHSGLSGYSLIEVLVVIAIIGFLAATALYVFNVARVKSRDAKRLADMKTNEKAIKILNEDSATGFPGADDIKWYRNDACTEDLGGDALFLSSLVSSTYINNIPDDPTINSTGGCYWYQRKNNGYGFILLMNPEYNSIVNEGMGCSSAGVPTGVAGDWYCLGDNWN